MRALRPTIRVRLTLIYSGLFLFSGVVLLFVLYLLLESQSGLVVPRTLGSATPSQVAAPSPGDTSPRFFQGEGINFEIRQAALTDLLVQGTIVVGILALGAILLGWLVAGRVLNPISRITATARRLSDRTLNERLALNGPNDELKEFGDTFDAMLDRLNAAFDAQRRFVANAAHELRTPLTVQRAIIDVALAQNDHLPIDIRAAMTELREVNVHNEMIIEGLLTLAVSQRGLEHQGPVDLAAIVDRALDSAPMSDGKVTVQSKIEPVDVVGDEVLLRRMVENLFDNAVRYNVPSGWVRVILKPDGDDVCFTVENSGARISDAECALIVEPFHRLRLNGGPLPEGTGLGLSIVAAISSAHGGHITARPLAPGGLSVTVRLPRMSRAEAAEVDPGHPGTRTSAQSL